MNDNDLFSVISSNANGITLQVSKLKIRIKIGAATKIREFAFVGINISFVNNFTPSANGCNNPHNPTTFGPRRLCIAAIIFLSANV